jgi:transposase
VPAMNHVAVDLGSKQSQFCVRKPDGSVVQEAKVANRALKHFFGTLEPSRVVLEACSEAFAVADWAKALGHEVCLVPSTLASALGVGARGVKTDKRDARNLSMTSCRMEDLPRVHLPSMLAREFRALCTSRASLVTSRTKMTNSVRGWMRTQLLVVPTGMASTLPKRVRAAAMERPEGLPMHIEWQLEVVELLSKQINEADKQVKELVERDEVCRRLMSAPGVGPLTAMLFRGLMDQVDRFPNAHAVQSYVGITPGENSSGERTQRTGTTRAGSPRMRAALVQAAWTAWRTKPGDPMVVWAKKIATRSSSQVAIVALARKMTGILYALWRDKTEYEPTRTNQGK